MPTTDPVELRRRADVLQTAADTTPDDVLACALYVRAFRERSRAIDLEAEALDSEPTS
jgi:hypothetical protein